jgi:hypothetical protein
MPVFEWLAQKIKEEFVAQPGTKSSEQRAESSEQKANTNANCSLLSAFC